MIGQAIWATKVDWNAKKMATKLSKNDMLILEYVQILIIGQAIQVTKVNQNVKNWLPSCQK